MHASKNKNAQWRNRVWTRSLCRVLSAATMGWWVQVVLAAVIHKIAALNPLSSARNRKLYKKQEALPNDNHKEAKMHPSPTCPCGKWALASHKDYLYKWRLNKSKFSFFSSSQFREHVSSAESQQHLPSFVAVVHSLKCSYQLHQIAPIFWARNWIAIGPC